MAFGPTAPAKISGPFLECVLGPISECSSFDQIDCMVLTFFASFAHLLSDQFASIEV